MKSAPYNEGTIFLDSKDWTFPIPIAYGADRLAEIGSICQRLDVSKIFAHSAWSRRVTKGKTSANR